MSHLVLLIVASAALVLVGQWISLLALHTAADRPLPARVQGRLVWWARHRGAVTFGCAAVAVIALAGGLLAR